MEQKNPLIIGVGNRFRSDDAAGLHVASRLRERLPSSVRILECSGEATELMEAWKQAESVLVIDALCSGNAAGQIQRFDVSQRRLPASWKLTSTHALGLAQAIELARALDELPTSVIVYGIEAVNFAPGQSLSPDVELAIDSCCEKIAAELQ